MLLILSNGHGEDLVGSRIALKTLQAQPGINVTALPLVGKGRFYRKLEDKGLKVRIVDGLGHLPSRGFGFLTLRWFWKDLECGFLGIIIHQVRESLRQARNDTVLILAVGDLYPLLLAWLSGKEFVYINTKKSALMFTGSMRNSKNILPRLRGTNWNFLELLIAKSSRCKGVVVRDIESQRSLACRSIETTVANPMFDGIEPRIRNRMEHSNTFSVMCLPGSRRPEAYSNFELILSTIRETCMMESFSARFVVACATEEIKEKLIEIARLSGLIELLDKRDKSGYGNIELSFDCNQFKTWLRICDISLSMAGTAAEQSVASGVPVIGIPGEGPQFTMRFALRQQRLLGESMVIAKTPKGAAEWIVDLYKHPERQQYLSMYGISRLYTGSSQSKKIARVVTDLLADTATQE